MTVTGNGIVTHNEGQMVGRPLVPVAPLGITNPDGIKGPPQFTISPQSMLLGSAKLDASVVGDQPISIVGADSYIVRRIVFARPVGVAATGLTIGMFSSRDGSGKTLIPDGQSLADLDPVDPYRIVDLPVSIGYYHRAPYFYARFNEAAALKIEAFVFGDVMVALPG